MLLFLLDYKLSVAVCVGIIAMAGLAAEMGLLMLHYIDNALANKPPKSNHTATENSINLIDEGAAERVRPMLMARLTLLIFLVPIMFSDGTGADVMKRTAARMVGGSIVTLLVVLFVLFVFSALFSIWKYGNTEQL